jgi:hypothetical protein
LDKPRAEPDQNCTDHQQLGEFELDVRASFDMASHCHTQSTPPIDQQHNLSQFHMLYRCNPKLRQDHRRKEDLRLPHHEAQHDAVFAVPVHTPCCKQCMGSNLKKRSQLLLWGPYMAQFYLSRHHKLSQHARPW